MRKTELIIIGVLSGYIATEGDKVIGYNLLSWIFVLFMVGYAIVEFREDTLKNKIKKVSK